MIQKVNASSVSRKLAKAFKREDYFAPGHVTGWGTFEPGFKVETIDGNVTVTWVQYFAPEGTKETKIQQMADYLTNNNYSVEQVENWRGPFLIVKAGA